MGSVWQDLSRGGAVRNVGRRFDRDGRRRDPPTRSPAPTAAGDRPQPVRSRMTRSPRERRAGHIDVVATRLLDVTLAVVLAVISLPVAVIVAVAVKLDSPGPVFFRCRRIGSGGRPFGMLKFRKM